MKSILENNTYFWFDDTLLSEPVQEIFEPEYWKRNDKVIGSAKGRGITWFVRTQSIDAALRHYRRGGLFGKLVKDQFWFNGWENTRSYLEFQLLNTLIEAGVNVPRPIAARAVKTGPYYQADLLSEKITNARDLVTILQEKPLPKKMYQKIGKEIKRCMVLRLIIPT